MPKNTKSINDNLFQMLKSHGYAPISLDSSGKKIPVPDEADVFQFKIRLDHGGDGDATEKLPESLDKPEEATVTVSIDDNHDLKVYYNSDASDDDNWYSLLRHLKKFASRNQMGFDPTDEDQLTYDMAKREHTKNESLRESEMKSGALTERYDEWDEADTWYQVIDGRMMRRDWKHAQEREARRDGWSQNQEQALRRAGIRRSKYNHDKWIKMNHATGKWDTVYPYGRPDEDKKDDVKEQDAMKGLNEMDSEGYKGTRDEPSKGKEHKAKAIPVKKMQSDALGTLNKAVKKQQRTLKYELRFSNGRTKRITAKDDADAVRQKKGLGATSVIRLKGDVPSGKVMEGYHAAGRRASINDSVPRVKILVQHTRPIEEGEQRFRNVERIFIENTQGERILVPTTNTAMARTFARLIAEGDKPYGDRWSHLQSLCEDYSALRGFVRATGGQQLNEGTERLVTECADRIAQLRESLRSLAKHHGYHAYFENWSPTLLEGAVDTGSVEQMLGESLLQDERVRSALPVLSRINSTISENASITEVDELEEWANNIIDETVDDLDEELKGKQKKLDKNANGRLDSEDFKMLRHKSVHEGGMGDVDVIMQEIGSVEELNRLMNEPQGPEEEYAAQELSEKFQEIAEREGLDPEEDHDQIAEMLLDEIAAEHGEEDTPHDDGLRDDGDEEESEPTVHEVAKPDFPDIDDDGNKKEPISKAARDAKEKGVKEGLSAAQKRVKTLGPTEKVGKKGPVGKLVGVDEGFPELDAATKKRNAPAVPAVKSKDPTFDTSRIQAMMGQKPDKEVGKVSAKHTIKTAADDEPYEEPLKEIRRLSGLK